MASFRQRLAGGHPNSLGHTVKIVAEVIEQPNLIEELFNCYFSEEEVVRLRTSNAMKRLANLSPDLLIPYLDRFLTEVSLIKQSSTQWTLAQLFLIYGDKMSKSQLDHAKSILKDNLENHHDWIVLNTTMDTLTQWSIEDQNLRGWFLEELQSLKLDKRKSVMSKAFKSIRFLVNGC